MRAIVVKAFIIPTLLLLANTSFAQITTERISAEEMREARRIAQSFSRRLQQTKDITPLIDDYFAKDFLDGYLQGSEQNWFVFLDRDFAPQLTRAELRRYLIAELNWFYLCELYLFSKYASSADGLDLPLGKMYPPDVLKVFLSDPLLKHAIDTKDSDAPDYLVSNADRFRTFVGNLERAARLLRKHTTRLNAGRTKQYRETLSDWKTRYHLYEPWLTSCDEQCLALPNDTELVLVNIPSVQLQFARVQGQMKIVSAWFLID
jgi:hypothetical protein